MFYEEIKITQGLYVFACMFWLIVFLFTLDSRLANYLGKKLSFWLSACSVLIVVPLL